MLRRFIPLMLALPALFAADPLYESAEAKLDRLDNRELKPGESVVFTQPEVNAWMRVAVLEDFPEGIRDTRVTLGMDSADAYAIVDFLKILESRGRSINSIFAKMVEGERPLKVSLRVSSGAGRCTVFLTRVELAGGVAEGGMLDFLVKTFFTPLYPNAKIGEPFEIGFDIDRIDIRPDGIRVTVKK